MKKYILTLDEGTTSARAIITDKIGKIISVAQNEFTQIYPNPSFVEHDPEEIFTAQYNAIKEAVDKANIDPIEIAGIGITNQRETTVVWDKKTGKPIYNAIVWQCRRTAEYCEQLIADGYEDYIRDVTGLKIDAYFSATKIKWILDNVEGAREKAKRGDLLFGTIDTWLLWILSGGEIHATDYTNACRTMLFDIHNLCYDKKLLNLFDIPESMLPQVYPSGHNYGNVNILGHTIPVGALVGDQQSALFGQKCFNPGDVKNTYGTGCFLLMNTGNDAKSGKNGTLTTLIATFDGEKPQYALEGSVFIGGAVIQWLRDELKIIKDAPDSETCAKKVENTGGVYIVPAFTGLGAPHWDMKARGAILGLTRGSNRNHIARAALEAIAYQTDDLINAMSADSGLKVTTLKADGGASKNGLLMQFQSDISDAVVHCPDNAEATAMGAAYIAGITVKLWNGKEDLPKDDLVKTYTPKMENTERFILKNGWSKAINAVKQFSN
ncbi:MAG: glycerol kinase GlpK [Clostridia bacterium]|nr:glycerol kinase GlpK [Clostridia bacterium]